MVQPEKPPPQKRAVQARRDLLRVILEQVSDQFSNRRALRTSQRDVSEKILALQFLNDSLHTVMTANPEVVSLSDIVGEHDARATAEPGKHGQQHIALQ